MSYMTLYGIFNEETKQVTPTDLGILAFQNRWQKTTKQGDYIVSTVFLGLDHGFGDTPLWFETMIYKDENKGHFLDYQERYETYEEAVKGHEQAIVWLRETEVESE